MKRPNILFFLAIFCLFLSAWFSTSLCTDRFYFPESSSNIALGGPTSLGDGCYHIFLDVGANIGVHSRFLMEPQKYPNATNALKIFESVFGAPDHRDNRDFCLFAFEPNPLHKERFLNFTNAYNNVGWKIFFMAAGVSNKDGEMIFYHVGDGKHNEWGFTTTCKRNSCIPESVPVVKLSDWISREIGNRMIPSSVYGRYPQGPKVVMKMDIEFQEFVVFPDMVVSGTLCGAVDRLFGEFHYGTARKPRFPHTFSDSNNITMNSGEEASNYITSIVRAVHANPSCKTSVTVGDDESYLFDGLPWPVPKWPVPKFML